MLMLDRLLLPQFREWHRFSPALFYKRISKIQVCQKMQFIESSQSGYIHIVKEYLVRSLNDEAKKMQAGHARSGTV